MKKKEILIKFFTILSFCIFAFEGKVFRNDSNQSINNEDELSEINNSFKDF